jgi:cytochrome b subunit of formate dehydrogenase
MTMQRATKRLAVWVACLAIAMGIAAPAGAAAAKSVAPPPAPPARLDTATCQGCHDGKNKLEVATADGKKRALHAIPPDKFAASVHAKLECNACHTDITNTAIPHGKAAGVQMAGCPECHQKLWDEAKQAGTTLAKPRLEVVVKNIEAYKRSFHAGEDKDHPGQAKAVCTQCHDTHTFHVPANKEGAEYAAWRREIPQLCGTCHDEQLDTYKSSIHGKHLLDEKDNKAPACNTCHTTHEITNTSLTSFKLLVTDVCGTCHKDRLASYRDTYHGQVTELGSPETAKCYNCHGSHGILPAKDPESTINVKNRLKTCQTCHDGKSRPLATAGFVSFGPHANSHDFEKYPQMWIATKFMQGLLIAVFAFFWAHSGLWYYRELQDRKAHAAVARVRVGDLPQDEVKFFQRFPVGWRIAHLLFALVTMTLVLTGTAALFSHTTWAPAVAKALGGARSLAIIHRVAATIFIGIFFVHFVYVLQRLLRSRSFRWFGPDSLIPNWKDLKDVFGMFSWFLGKGPKPRFDRWTYFEKFDYWAVFWGVTIIGTSGLMLAFPTVTGQFLPGWVFNVATVVHGEEAFLAAVFLFTVHFFNNHFRPDKLPPPDIVMFTGTQSLEEFRKEHPAQYQRLVDSGELEKYLVDAPSRPMTIGSKILGVVLIIIGLTLLTMVAIGFFTTPAVPAAPTVVALGG